MKELVALKKRDAESISALAIEKNSLLNDLEKIDQERQHFIQNSHASENQPVSNEIDLLSNEIENCLNKCKKQNSINGGIIEMSKLFNEKMLDIISGNPAKESTYGASGKNNSAKNQHSLGRV